MDRVEAVALSSSSSSSATQLFDLISMTASSLITNRNMPTEDMISLHVRDFLPEKLPTILLTVLPGVSGLQVLPRQSRVCSYSVLDAALCASREGRLAVSFRVFIVTRFPQTRMYRTVKEIAFPERPNSASLVESS